jgi:hypothetical protein
MARTTLAPIQTPANVNKIPPVCIALLLSGRGTLYAFPQGSSDAALLDDFQEATSPNALRELSSVR